MSEYKNCEPPNTASELNLENNFLPYQLIQITAEHEINAWPNTCSNDQDLRIIVYSSMCLNACCYGYNVALLRLLWLLRLYESLFVWQVLSLIVLQYDETRSTGLYIGLLINFEVILPEWFRFDIFLISSPLDQMKKLNRQNEIIFISWVTLVFWELLQFSISDLSDMNMAPRLW